HRPHRAVHVRRALPLRYRGAGLAGDRGRSPSDRGRSCGRVHPRAAEHLLLCRPRRKPEVSGLVDQGLLTGRPAVRLVAAPNPYKGSLGAPAAARAIALGARDVFADAEVFEVPVADGGEGTVEALVAARGGEMVSVTVRGPLSEPVDAAFGLIDGGNTAVLELAASSGLPLLSPERRDPRVTSTYGFGQQLDAARRLGVQRIIAGIGGSATNDGGAGMAQALGFS